MNKKLSLLILGILLVGIPGIIWQPGTSFFQKTFNGQSQPSPKIQVTASFYPLAEFAQQVGQDKIEVHNLTPAGAQPHDFDPSPRDLVRLQNSQLLIYNGAGLEPWLNKIDDEIKQKLTMVDASQNIPLLSGIGEAKTFEAKTANEVRPDPHFWLDPSLASLEVENIKNGLVAVDPTNKDFYEKNAVRYQRQLADLATTFRTGLAQCQRRELVTSHHIFQYLAKRYELSVLAISGLSPDEEPSPQKLAGVTQFVKQRRVTYIFFESLVSPKLSQTIAQETGAQTIAFNPLEGLTSAELTQGKNYLSVQRDNLTALRTALECK